MTIIQFLKEFPAIFAFLGLIVGGGVMFWVNKKYGPMRNDAIDEVVKAYKERIQAMVELAKVQAEQYMATLNIQREHWAEELSKLEKDRDSYRNQLHEERKASQSLTLRVQELELLPSVDGIQTEQQNFFREMLTLMKGISQALKTHDEGIDARIKPLHDACHETAESMKELVQALRPVTRKPRKNAN